MFDLAAFLLPTAILQATLNWSAVLRLIRSH